MASPSRPESNAMQALREIAFRYPEVEEGASCHNRAFKARKKAFLFMGMDDDSWNVKIKLGGSLPEAEALSEKSPDNFSVGGHGWTEVTFPHDQSPPAGLMERWIDESFRLLIAKTLVKTLPESGPPA